MWPRTVTVIANVGEPPFSNNLLPVLRAFRRIAPTHLVEPIRHRGFVSTGAAAPAPLPRAAVRDAARPRPDLVVCVGGGLFIRPRHRRLLPAGTVVVGIALSDPQALEASLAIAPTFDLFLTQDPGALAEYRRHGVEAVWCRLAVDPEALRPVPVPETADVLFVGRWTPYRESLLEALADRWSVRIHAHREDRRWSLPVEPPLVTEPELAAAYSGTRIALDVARVEAPGTPHHGALRLTPRALFAAACATPCLVEAHPGLEAYFEPGREIATFTDPDELVTATERLLRDPRLRQTTGRAARGRVLAEHTWTLRARWIVERAGAAARGGRGPCGRIGPP